MLPVLKFQAEAGETKVEGLLETCRTSEVPTNKGHGIRYRSRASLVWIYALQAQ